MHSFPFIPISSILLTIFFYVNFCPNEEEKNCKKKKKKQKQKQKQETGKEKSSSLPIVKGGGDEGFDVVPKLTSLR
jgi:hypothetical protein